jgi:hypothetical protein
MSGKRTNPRHAYGAYLLINSAQLLGQERGRYRGTLRADTFLKNSPEVVGAIRGTLITLGRFAKGVENAAIFPGAAPITLIDGERLVELVEKHQVGLRRKPAYLLEVDEAFFAERNLETASSRRESCRVG